MEIGSGRILVADGDTRSRVLAGSTLRLIGYEVQEVATGDDALRCALEDPPALVILDADLPGMSGYDVCAELKREYGDALPIVLMSGMPTHTLHRVARAIVGGDEYVLKTVSPRKMLRLIGAPGASLS